MPAPHRLVRTLTLVSLAAGLMCCDDCQCPGSTEPASDPGYVLRVLPIGGLALTNGGTGTGNIQVVRSGGFRDVITLRIVAPPGIDASPASTSMSYDMVFVDFAVSVPAATTPGTYWVRVVGSATGLADRTDSLAVSVAEALPGSFTLWLSPTTRVLLPGQRDSVLVSIARVPPFDRIVDLAVTGTPQGVYAICNPQEIAPGAVNSRLVLEVSAEAGPGTWPLTVTGTSNLVVSQSAVLTLTVLPLPRGFTLMVSPDTLVVPQRGRGTAAVTIARTATFSGDVALTVTGAPAGVSTSFAPATLPGSSTASTLTVNVGDSVALGAYPLTVRGAASGLDDATAPLVLRVPALGITITTTSMVVVRQGGLGSAPLGIGRIAPFTGAVTLTAEGLPAGVTAVFTPATLAPGQTAAQVVYTALTTVPVGTYRVTIRASGEGVPTAIATQDLLVTAQ